jgi:hypothetical protein
MKHTAELVEMFVDWVMNVVMEHAPTWILTKPTVVLVGTLADWVKNVVVAHALT